MSEIISKFYEKYEELRILLIVLLCLNLADYTITLALTNTSGIVEGNPIMRHALEQGTFWLDKGLIPSLMLVIALLWMEVMKERYMENKERYTRYHDIALSLLRIPLIVLVLFYIGVLLNNIILAVRVIGLRS